MRGDRAGYFLREKIAIDRERRPGRHARRVGGAHDDRSEPAHLLFQKADCVVQFVSTERIAADKLRKPVGLVDRRRLHRTHFVNAHRNAE
jgi:hypothetical protein